LLQTGAEIHREPLLTWAPTPPKSHPVDYFVPNFGVDHDIAASTQHEKDASAKLGHVWTPVWDPVKEEWNTPTEDAFFKI